MPFSSRKIRRNTPAAEAASGFIGYTNDKGSLAISLSPADAGAETNYMVIATGIIDNISTTVSTIPSGFTQRKNNTQTGFYCFTDDVWDGTNTSVSIDDGSSTAAVCSLLVFAGYEFDTIGEIDSAGNSTNPTPESITLSSNDSIVICVAGDYGTATSDSGLARPSGYTGIFYDGPVFAGDGDPELAVSYITGISAGSYNSGSVSLDAVGNAFLIGLRPA